MVGEGPPASSRHRIVVARIGMLECQTAERAGRKRVISETIQAFMFHLFTRSAPVKEQRLTINCGLNP